MKVRILIAHCSVEIVEVDDCGFTGDKTMFWTRTGNINKYYPLVNIAWLEVDKII